MKEVYDAHQYTDANSCLFINQEGKLIRIRCPFEVVQRALLNLSHNLPITGLMCTVTRVLSINNQIHFEIGNVIYLHNNYVLITDIQL